MKAPWGTSQLYLKAKNAFGEKQHKKPIFQTIVFPTKEFWNGKSVTIVAKWVNAAHHWGGNSVSSLAVPGNGGVSLRDVANPSAVFGCHWEF